MTNEQNRNIKDQRMRYEVQNINKSWILMRAKSEKKRKKMFVFSVFIKHADKFCFVI
jgi:hypothetical protein